MLNTIPFANYLAADTPPILKFNSGHWYAGQEADEVRPDQQFCVLIPTLQTGWIHWKDGKPDERKYVHALTNAIPPKRQELGDLCELDWPQDKQGKPRDPWQQEDNVIVISHDDGDTLLFSTGTYGGRKALQKLTRAWISHGERAFPVVTLQSESVKNQHGSITERPVFEIVGWSEPDNFTQVLEMYLPGYQPPVPQLEAKPSTAEIIDDDIPF